MVAESMTDTHEQEGSQHERRHDSQPRRVSGLAKFIFVGLGVLCLVWLVTALTEKEAVTGTNNPESSVGDVDDLRYATPAPVLDGDTRYTLGTLAWVFEPQAEDEAGVTTTRIRLKLVDFKRNDVPIDVAQYRLGVYRGSCDVVDEEVYAASVPDRNSLTFAQCWFAGSGKQLGVFQEGPLLVVKARMIAEEDERFAELEPILTIDMRTIIQ